MLMKIVVLYTFVFCLCYCMPVEEIYRICKEGKDSPKYKHLYDYFCDHELQLRILKKDRGWSNADSGEKKRSFTTWYQANRLQNWANEHAQKKSKYNNLPKLRNSDPQSSDFKPESGDGFQKKSAEYSSHRASSKAWQDHQGSSWHGLAPESHQKNQLAPSYQLQEPLKKKTYNGNYPAKKESAYTQPHQHKRLFFLEEQKQGGAGPSLSDYYGGSPVGKRRQVEALLASQKQGGPSLSEYYEEGSPGKKRRPVEVLPAVRLG